MNKIYQILLSVVFFTICFNTARATTFYTRAAGGNWNTLATWSTVGCNGAIATSFPGASDDVIICNSNGATVVTVTVNGNYSCNNLTIGTGAASATLAFATGPFTFTVGGTVSFNAGNGAGTYSLSAGASTAIIGGFVNWNTVAGSNKFLVSSGTLTFAQDLTIANANQFVSISAAGKVNFNGDFVDSQNKLTTFAACSVRFAGNYTVNSIAAVWIAGAFAVFNGTSKSITPNANITFSNVTLGPGASYISNSSTGVTAIARDLSLSASSTLTSNADLTVTYGVALATGSVINLNANLTIARAWTNNGGTLNGGSYAVRFTGYSYIIGGTSATAFPNLYIGVSGTATQYAYTQNSAVTCTSFTMESNSYAGTSSYTLGATNPSLTINGDLTIKQLTSLKIVAFYVNGGSCLITGNLVFSGTGTSSTAQVSQVVSTTGPFTLNGTITWLNQSGAAQVATELIQTTSGILTFNSSVAMPVGSGTIKATGAGTINFNGVSAPSLNYNAAGVGSVYAVLSVVSGTIVNFKAGITNAYTLTFAAGSYQNFTGTGTIIPTAAVRFGHFAINSGITVTSAGSFSLQNTWSNLGTYVPGLYTVTFNGGSTVTQSIARTGGETFYGLAMSTASATLILGCNITITSSLSMTGHSINLSGYTLTLGSGSTASLTRSAGQAYGGTFKRYWAASTPVTTTNYGLFPVGIPTAYRPVLLASTVSPTAGGYIQAVHTVSYSVTNTSYNDGVNSIQRISDQNTVVSTTSITGGTYNIDVYFGGFNNTGVITDLKLETFTGAVNGAVGTHATTTGTVTAPVCKRTALSVGNLNNVFVAGTKSKTATPIINYYYTRSASADWSNTAAWSIVSGGAGASCTCVPLPGSYAVISPNQTITFTSAVAIDYINVEAGASITGTANMTIGKELNINGTGTVNPTAGTWSVVDLNYNSSGSSTIAAPVNVSGNFILAGGSTINMGATLTLSGDADISGTLNLGSSTLVLAGVAAKTISGTGTINGSSAAVNITTASKSTLPTTSLTIVPPVTLSNNIVLTNQGSLTLIGNLVGSNSSSGLVNAAGSVLRVQNALLSTGTLTASAVSNTVDYNGAGAQNIKNTTYDVLTTRNSGTKSLIGNTVANTHVGVYDASIIDESTYTLTGAANLEMLGTAELKMQRGSSGTYPELSGNYTLTGGIVTINQTAGTAILQGETFESLKFKGAGTYDLSGVTHIAVDLEMLNSTVATNLGEVAIGGTFTYSSSGTTTLTGDVTSSSFLISSGTLNIGTHDFTITGPGFTNNGGTFTSSGAVNFTSAAAQSISGSNPTTFHQLGIHNTNISGVTLNQPVTVSTELDMVSGKLNTDATNILTLADNATASQTTLNSFVNGVMRKIGDDEFIFPIGDGSRSGRVGISAPASAATVFKAEYNAVEYGNPETAVYPLAWASHLEHWLLDRTGSASGVEVTLYWENASTSMIDNCDVLTIAHWNGATWEEMPATASGSCSGSGAGSITTDYQMFSFSPFTFGSNDPHDNPLPVSLVEFEVKAVGANAEIKWTTASETNNDFFTVERSSDGINYEEIFRHDGAGNSTTSIDYFMVDFNALSGMSYYRLKQTDFNGMSVYSDIVPVQISTNINDAQRLVHIFPTPSIDGTINVQSGNKLLGKDIGVKIYDIKGKIVFSSAFNSSEVKTSFNLNHQLLPGAYFLMVEAEGIIDRIPVLIVH